MENTVILVPRDFSFNAIELFKKHRIQFTVAGCLDQDVMAYEKIDSSMNKPKKTIVIEKKEPEVKETSEEKKPIPIVKKTALKIRKPEEPKTDNYKPQKEHNQMRAFAKSLGCDDIGSAIAKVGSAVAFRRKFKQEYLQNK